MVECNASTPKSKAPNRVLYEVPMHDNEEKKPECSITNSDKEKSTG